LPSRRAKLPRGKYLEHAISLHVQLREVDALGVVWHGNYLAYFEAARETFGRRYALGFDEIAGAGLMAPIVQVSCDYLSPAKYGDELDITARLFRQDAAKAVFHFEARRRADQTLLAVGRTVQAFTTLNGELLLSSPDFMNRFYALWAGSMLGSDE